MQVSIVDLRYKMNDVLKALDRNEKVTVLYHGKEKGILIPFALKNKKKARDFPFCGMYAKSKKSVEKQMEELRDERY